MALAACAEAPEASRPPEPFTVTFPAPTPGFYEREYVGDVKAVQYVEVTARVDGVIDTVAVDEGQGVKKGQLLFSIDARGHRQELLKARAGAQSCAAELRAAELELEQSKRLLEKNVVSPAEVAMLSAKVSALGAKLEEAKAHEGQAALELSYAEVRAPFDGVVSRIPKRAGTLVAPGDLLTSITNPDEVFVYFNLSEQEYLKYASSNLAESNKQVAIKTATGEAFPQLGVIDAIGSEFDKSTGNLAFRARIKNDGRLLKHGSTVKVVMKLATGDALMVAQKATFEVQDQLYVYAVDAENRVRAKKIVPAFRINDAFVVESGLTAADRFIVEGLQKVKDGDQITITQLAANTNAPHTAMP